MNRALRNYIEEIKSEVASLVYSDGEGASFEDKFTEYCIEVLDSIGKSDGARVLSYLHPNKNGSIDWKINGYSLRDLFRYDNRSEHFETLDLFYTYFKTDSYEYNITKDEYTKSVNQIKRFINAALKRHIDYIDPSNTELNELIKIIGKQGDKFDRVNVYFLINGFSNHDKEKIVVNNIDVYIHTWDISRLFKINESNSIHEPIEINFNDFSEDGDGLQCLKVPNIDELYDCYLAIVPGSVLSKLYKEFSNELLESNVRAFLGQAGKFNKGIRDTIRNKPQMFLPYNNGITATAESVETDFINNQLIITKLNDFQIVNGGQTTASLYHTSKKFKDVDLSKIFVQMKLTVIKDKELKHVEVPNIARFANSQNKVSELDLSSNNPFFVQIENLSRKKYVIDPENKNSSLLWYFERAKGQYRETLNKLTPANQRKFKTQSPSSLKFVKSDIAKYINIWEQEPHFVSQGSQKNFIQYTKKINDLIGKNKLPGDNFYRKLIANAILFKTTDKLFGRKNVNAIGDTNIKSFSVSYTLSYFHYLTNNRIDLWRIYEEQRVDDFLSEHLKKLLVFVYEFLITESNNSLISEFAKKETTWKRLKEVQYTYNLTDLLDDYLISEDEKDQRESEKELNMNNVDDTLFVISEIHSLGAKFWDGLKRFLIDNEVAELDKIIIHDIYSRIKNGTNLALREIAHGKKVLDFINEDLEIIDEIKDCSDVPESESPNIKSIYDRLSLLSKDEWNRYLDLGGQTKIFDNLELANIKTVYNTMLKNELIKEQALLKCYSSLLKLKKFGVKI